MLVTWNPRASAVRQTAEPKNACQHKSRREMYNSDLPTKPFPPTTSNFCTMGSMVDLPPLRARIPIETYSIDIGSSSSILMKVSNDC